MVASESKIGAHLKFLKKQTNSGIDLTFCCGFLLEANLLYATERKIITIQGFGNKRTCSYFSTGQGVPLKMLIYPAPLQYSITIGLALFVEKGA